MRCSTRALRRDSVAGFHQGCALCRGKTRILALTWVSLIELGVGAAFCGTPERPGKRLSQQISMIPRHKGHWFTPRIGHQ